MKLNTAEWKEFSVEQLFYIKRGKTLSTDHKKIYKGNIPCVNGSSENNGVFCHLAEDITEIGFELLKAPALTLARVGNAGKTFVQSSDFFVADNAFCLILKKNQGILAYLFLSTLLDLETVKYSYGRTISMEKYRKLLLKLPVGEEGEPDFDYMTRYMERLHSKPLRTAVRKTRLELDIAKWGSYTLDSLFDFVKGKTLIRPNKVPGNVNFLGAVRENNGVRERIETSFQWKPNCITVNYNGSVGEAFYQSEPFWASDDVNVLYAKKFWTLNQFTAMFIITVIKENRYRFGYGRKWTLEKMKETVIKLPCKEDGEPDFEYMEKYIRSLPYSDRI